MSNLEQQIDNHYGHGGVMEKIEAGLQLAEKNLTALTVDDLAPVDEFHTRGRAATLELAALGNVNSADKVLDVGCGLGGTARHLAEQYKCRVSGIDLTEEYITVGKKLTELVRLGDYVDLHHGSALELPFADQSFDVVWTEHVQMNIPDKNRFYAEIARVLKAGGTFLFHDIFRGSGEPPHYPVPWAEDESLSHLATEQQAQTVFRDVGLETNQWLGKVDESITFFETVLDKISADGPPPLGIHLLMGDNAKDKLTNYIQNLRENRTSVAMGRVTAKLLTN